MRLKRGRCPLEMALRPLGSRRVPREGCRSVSASGVLLQGELAVACACGGAWHNLGWGAVSSVSSGWCAVSVSCVCGDGLNAESGVVRLRSVRRCLVEPSGLRAVAIGRAVNGTLSPEGGGCAGLSSGRAARCRCSNHHEAARMAVVLRPVGSIVTRGGRGVRVLPERTRCRGLESEGAE